MLSVDFKLPLKFEICTTELRVKINFREMPGNDVVKGNSNLNMIICGFKVTLKHN